MVFTRAQEKAREIYGRTRALTKQLRATPFPKVVDIPVRKTRLSSKKKRERVSRNYFDVEERVEAEKEHPLHAFAEENVRRTWTQVDRKPKVFYPIYSDLPGAWQADLMFYTMKNPQNRMM